MKYDHRVKHNGVWYEPFEEIPEDKQKRGYTKTDIAKMPVEDLRNLAVSAGMEDAREMNGTELRQYLLSMFGL